MRVKILLLVCLSMCLLITSCGLKDGGKDKDEIEAEVEVVEEKTFKILIEWDGKYPNNGELIDLQVNVNQITKNKTAVAMNEETTDISDDEGNVIGTFEKENSSNKGKVTIEIFDSQSTFSIDTHEGRYYPGVWDNEISLSNAKATVYVNGKKSKVYQVERGILDNKNGHSFWGVCGIEKGEVVKYDDLWAYQKNDWWPAVPPNVEIEEEKTTETSSSKSIEARVKEIKEVYYEIQNHPSNYQKKTVRANVEHYTKDGKICKIVAKAGAFKDRGYNNDYTVQYYYDDDGQVVFAFVYRKGEEHRFYYDKVDSQKIIRYIGPDRVTHNYENGVRATSVSTVGYFCDFAMDEMQ